MVYVRIRVHGNCSFSKTKLGGFQYGRWGILYEILLFFYFFVGGHLEELGLCHVYKAEENAHKVE